ncbi:MAG: ThuA domain-containing protein [Phycisphaeraceae bacterium]
MTTRLLARLMTFAVVAGLFHAYPGFAEEGKLWVTYPGGEGIGQGKHVVLVSGDDEYRSEEILPQFGKILSKHHGFKCTVLFAIDPETGHIKPSHQTNIPGLEALATADLMVIATRFRNLPNEQMEHIDAYLKTGKPVIGMRTATHAFRIRDKNSPYHKYDFRSSSEGWSGGFGTQILGETWVSHHAKKGVQSTRGIVAEGAEDHPILKGIAPGAIWADAHVYTINLPMAESVQPIVMGGVLSSMSPDGELADSPKNDPMMPVAWINHYEVVEGNKGRVFTTTMGAGKDFHSEGTRRLMLNAALWCMGMENAITEEGLPVDLVGEYEPNTSGFNKYKKGLTPADFAL